MLRQFRSLISKLNAINFMGLTGYNIGSALTITVRDLLVTSPTILEVFKRIISALFFKNYYYEAVMQPEAKILFLFSHSYAVRDDQKIIFGKVTSLLQNGKDIFIANPRHRLFDMKGFLLVFYLPAWLIQMHELNIGLKDKLYLAAFLIDIKKWTAFFELKINPLKYKMLLTFCDAHLADNVMTQWFETNGIITATLQHGWYRKTQPSADTFSNIELGFEGFVSDKFLVWGEVARAYAVASGVNPERLLCLGNPKYIDYKVIDNKVITNIFGVILGRSTEHCIQENKNLIQFANSVSRKFGLKYIVKYHPADSWNEVEEYGLLIQGECLHARCGQDTSLEEYLMQVDFSLVGSSSVYADLLYLGEIAFCYTYVNDDYDEVSWGKFNFQENLMDLVEAYYQDKHAFRHNAKKVGQLLCGRGNIADNYRSFLSNYL